MSSFRRPSLVLAAVAVCLTAGCGHSSKHAPTATPTSVRGASSTVWLCRPGQAPDPCTSDPTTTAVTANGHQRVVHVTPAKTQPPIDCFYVYPTVSGQATVNADLVPGFREQEVAIAQASRFSQVCRVFAPVYRQITLAALDHPARVTLAHALIAYDGVVAAFRDYLAHDNHGRGFVLIGHSQGAIILTRLLRTVVDPSPVLRRRLVSALLLGANVTVAKGKRVGGDFSHVPLCASRNEARCVVAYSSFTSAPAANAEFGRTTSDAGVGLLTPHSSTGDAIACVNPAAPAGGTGVLAPAIPNLVLAFTGSTLQVTTPWVSYTGGYSARCRTTGNASWLQIIHTAGATDTRPLLTRFQQPVFGLHLLDVNIALDNLVSLVGAQANAYAHR